jgi:hypothetical protein
VFFQILRLYCQLDLTHELYGAAIALRRAVDVTRAACNPAKFNARYALHGAAYLSHVLSTEGDHALPVRRQTASRRRVHKPTVACTITAAVSTSMVLPHLPQVDAAVQELPSPPEAALPPFVGGAEWDLIDKLVLPVDVAAVVHDALHLRSYAVLVAAEESGTQLLLDEESDTTKGVHWQFEPRCFNAVSDMEDY